jgi:hypothetical protein
MADSANRGRSARGTGKNRLSAILMVVRASLVADG